MIISWYYYIKISMSIYSMYGHIHNIYTIIYVPVWSHTSCTYSSFGQIRSTSWDTHVGVDTSECRKKGFFIYIYIYIYIWVLSTLACSSIPPWICPRTHLSLWVYFYTNSKIFQRDMYEKFWKHPYFLNISWLYISTSI
jgi:hypothetical protein